MKTFNKDLIIGSRSDEDSELKVQWVAEKNNMDCEVVMPKPPLKDDGEFDRESLPVSKGYVEDYASRLRDREIVQFERFGFCILDDKPRMSFIFMSK